jgi:aromatic-amino-acid transaminase
VFRTAGFELLEYRYYDAASHGLDFAGMLADLGKLEPGTVVLLHACCHNPTGVDLDAAQWKQVDALLKERRLLPFIDMAYQGFDKGIDADAPRCAACGVGHRAFVVANSYSKSFSLYGERVGALSMVAANRDEAVARAVEDQADHSFELFQPVHAWRRAGRRRARQRRAARVVGAGAGRDALTHSCDACRHGRKTGCARCAAIQFHSEAGRHVLVFGLSKAQVHRLRDEHTRSTHSAPAAFALLR